MIPNPVALHLANTINTVASLMVTVRRDFPLRDGELLGEWKWSDSDGSRLRSPMRWLGAIAGPLQAGQQRLLNPEESRPIFGWSIGKPTLGKPGAPAGGNTTDHSDPIAALVELVRADGSIAAQARTHGDDGLAQLTTSGLDGPFTLRIVPDDHVLDNIEAGPDIAQQNPPRLLYRRTEISLRLAAGRLTELTDPYDPPAGKTAARIGNRHSFDPSTTGIPVSLKPVWWRHEHTRPRAGGLGVDLVIIHRTGGARLGGAFNEWFKKSEGPHYLIDIDGHVIKLVQDTRAIAHISGGVDRWQSLDRLNDRSIGFEIVNPTRDGWQAYPAFTNQGNPSYTSEQYRAVIRLCDLLVNTFPTIGSRIVGHSDVALGSPPQGTPNDRYGTKRNFDPGVHFEWERLEAARVGMQSGAYYSDAASYAGLFQRYPGIAMRLNDRDAAGSANPIYGGQPRPQFIGNAVQELQADLQDIGYAIRVNGRFDKWTEAAVDRFKRHFFAGTRGQLTGGRVTRDVATWIKNVAEKLRNP